MLSSAALLLSGNVAASGLLLIRNLVLARVIPVADYGVAATFAVVIAVFEMASELGLQKQIVQAREGDDPHFQAVLQGFQIVRGGLTGLAFLMLAEPAAHFLGVPEVAWAYRVLAVIPILRAFTHFDIWRLNRQMKFWPLVLTNAVPPLLSLLLIWPLGRIFGSWEVMLWALVVQMAIATAISHIVAERPYRLAFDRKIIAGSLRFGWPVLINGILLFGVFNGDRIIVGRELGMVALGVFAMGTTLTLPPALVLVSSSQSLFLPRLAELERTKAARRADFERMARANFEAHLLFGIGLVMGVAVFGGCFVDLVLGSGYVDLKGFLIPLAIQQALRIAKDSPATIALASAQTTTPILANAVRLALLPVAWLLVHRTGSIFPVIWTAVAAEGLGLAITLALVILRLRIDYRPVILPSVLMGLVLVAASYDGFWACSLALLLACLSITSMGSLRSYWRALRHV